MVNQAMGRDAALERARKLYAVAERPGTPAEGEVARHRLAKIMHEHKLSALEVAVKPAAPRPSAPDPRKCKVCGKVEVVIAFGGFRMSNFGSSDRCPECQRAEAERAKAEVTAKARAEAEARMRRAREREHAAEEARRYAAAEARARADETMRERREAEAKSREMKERFMAERQKVRAEMRQQATSVRSRDGQKVYHAKDYQLKQTPKAGTKAYQIWEMMSRPEGVTTGEACSVLGWTRKSVRARISELNRTGTLK